jgi:hypothetical protein
LKRSIARLKIKADMVQREDLEALTDTVEILE